MRPLAVIAASAAVCSLACSNLKPLPGAPIAPEGRVITQDMITLTSAKNAWDIIKGTGMFRMSDESGSARPSISSRRGRSSMLLAEADAPHIIVDGTRVNDAAYLYVIPAGSIASIRILNGIDGGVREGLNSGAGAIYVTTRAGR